MPSADEHQRQAEHNTQFLQTIDSDEFTDWLATVAFYVAVHLIEKLRALHDQHSIDHVERNTFVIDHHSTIHVYYRELYNLSRIARYGISPHHWLLPEWVTDCLDEIRRYVRDLT
jgi:hypothetical protein